MPVFKPQSGMFEINDRSFRHEAILTNLWAYIQLSANGDVNETVLTNYLAKNLNEEWGIVIAEAVSDCVTDYDGACRNISC